MNVLREQDVNHYMPGAVLAKVDRMSMRHGLEVRTPFLSPEMGRFAQALPVRSLAEGRTGKLILRRLAAR
ncbi:asparagine synthase-related protein, partial [Klebsiella pneumoniae]|uniref:asparagine synthase-related protein n=1 Tax=Klebsiella pneumoniae TaxID=573 RepID=UPI00351F126F